MNLHFLFSQLPPFLHILDAIKASLDSKEESTVKLKDEVKQTKQKLSNQEKLTNFSESASRKSKLALIASKIWN
jgi:hypothetical protein